MDADAPRGTQGRKMMERKLRKYLGWKGMLGGQKWEGLSSFGLSEGSGAGDGNQKKKGPGSGADGDGDRISEALKRKDQVMKERGASRRRVRGGAAAAGRSRDVGSKNEKKDIAGEGEMRDEAERIAKL
jgi:DNA excision repair protein ERCC-4